jgi:CRISPR-associated protein Cas5h
MSLPMKLVSFKLNGRFGHFLRAEGGASALSYPIPPRTAILGILGAILGLPKDQPQVSLEPASIALTGKLPQTHWHKAKLRKDPPEVLPRTIKKTQKSEKTTKPEKATLISQEWLLNPEYTVWVAVPEPYMNELEHRLKERRCHFQPSLGLSEMLAEVEYLKTAQAVPLPEGRHLIRSVFPQTDAELDWNRIFETELVIHNLRMPRLVTPDRIFTHASFFIERDGRPVPVKTARAFQTPDEVVLFL